MARSGELVAEIGTRIADTAPGSTARFLVDLVTRPSGSPLQMAFEVVKGSAPGPTVAVISGVHGDEPMAPLALRRFLGALDATALSGTLLVVPLANPVAFEQRRRMGRFDEVDLVRIWPGDEAGSSTHQMAALVFAAIAEHCDFLIDLHSGTQVLHEFWVIYANGRSPAADTSPEVEEASRQMAIAFGTDQIIRAHPWITTVSAAGSAGIPMVLAEIGGGPGAHTATGDFLRMMENGLGNVLKHLGMMPGSPVFEHPVAREYDVAEEFVAPESRGIWERRVASGDEVEAGSVLGGFVDPLTGDDLHTVTATAPGTVLNAMATWPQIEPGQWLMATGRLVATHERAAG
jgi:predicted deacylase